MSVEARGEYERNNCTKKHNARFEGFQILACSEIRKGEEILIDYHPGDQTAETKKILEDRRKTKKLSGAKQGKRLRVVSSSKQGIPQGVNIC